MSETKFTEGPWTANVGTRGAHINVANDYNHPLSFEFTYSDIDAARSAEGQANAHLIAAAPEMYGALERAATLVKLLTVRQVIEAGDKATEAAGLNPWCINEGLATGGESIGSDWIDFALAKARGEEAT